MFGFVCRQYLKSNRLSRAEGREVMLRDCSDIFKLIEACMDEARKKMRDAEPLHARIAELEAENEKLRDLVYRAYQEGFGDAPSKRSEHDNSGDDMAEAWEASYANAALKGEKA